MGKAINKTCAMVGGKPKVDWSGLDGPPVQVTPFIYRYAAGNSSKMKLFHLRSTPPPDFKIMKKDELDDLMMILVGRPDDDPCQSCK